MILEAKDPCTEKEGDGWWMDQKIVLKYKQFQAKYV